MIEKQPNPNVRKFYLFTALQSLGRGVWMGNVLSLYIILLSEKGAGIFGLLPNELLGVTSAITGIAMVLVVVPGGLLADRWSKEGMLKIAAGCGILGIVLLGWSSTILHIIGGLFLWGLFQGLSRPAIEAMFADSVRSGARSGIYARVHFIQQFGMAVGPLLNIVLFLILGDRWELPILKSVMLVGLLFSVSSCLVMVLLRESHTIGQESESLYIRPESSGGETHPAANKLDTHQRRGVAAWVNHTLSVPAILLLSNFLIGLGAGMTIKFFPVFFRAIYGLLPIAVQWIMGATFLATGTGSLLFQRLSLKRGRAEMMFAGQALSILCLVAIASYPSLWLLVPLFLLRGTLMNASQPLSRSIVMDFVPKKQRGIWNSLQSVAWGLFWNASAAVGGFLIGDNNFRFCFLITAGIYVLGTLPILLIIPRIHKEEAAH